MSCFGWSWTSIQNEIDFWRLRSSTVATLHCGWYQLGYDQLEAICKKYQRPQTTSNTLYLSRDTRWSDFCVPERIPASTNESFRTSIWGSVVGLWSWGRSTEWWCCHHDWSTWRRRSEYNVRRGDDSLCHDKNSQFHTKIEYRWYREGKCSRWSLWTLYRFRSPSGTNENGIMAPKWIQDLLLKLNW